MDMLLQPSFFAPIIQYVALASEENIVFEIQDNFQKQTYRNRCYIYGANGMQLLTVPVKHSKRKQRQKTKDLKIDNSFFWDKIIIKSLEASYRSSPYFEFYEDEIMRVFEKKHDFLLDLNLHTHEVVANCLELNQKETKSIEYEPSPEGTFDLRHLVDAKNQPDYDFDLYKQVFDKKFGFISNLSILDLLFNEGTNALTYLQAHRPLIKV